MATASVCVYLACSLDGFIAGPEHDLSWLPSGEGELPGTPAADPEAVGYETFIAGIGSVLMGRRTYDVVRGFGGPWHYGQLPIHVPTHRPLDADAPVTVRAVSGPIETLVADAKIAAGDKNVYLDGGDLVRQAADAGLIDHFILTYAPIALGGGTPLFGAIQRYYPLDILGSYRYRFGMLQVHARPRRDR